MTPSPNVERGILVFSIWAVPGIAGLCLVLEGFSRDSYLISLFGIGLLIATFLAHIIVNAIFGQGFTPGETVLGIGSFGVLALVFLFGSVRGALSMSDFYAGITLFGSLAAGLLVYLSTRYGLRGAFSKFHAATAPVRERTR